MTIYVLLFACWFIFSISPRYCRASCHVKWRCCSSMHRRRAPNGLGVQPSVVVGFSTTPPRSITPLPPRPVVGPATISNLCSCNAPQQQTPTTSFESITSYPHRPNADRNNKASTDRIANSPQQDAQLLVSRPLPAEVRYEHKLPQYPYPRVLTARP